MKATSLLGWRKVAVAIWTGMLIVIPFLLNRPLSGEACYALAGIAAAAMGANAAAKFAKGGKDASSD